MTTAVFNKKIGEVRNKIPDVSGLVMKTVYDAKILDIKKKYFIIADYNKFTSNILNAKIKQKTLFYKYNISNDSLHLRQNFGIMKTSIKIQFSYLFCFS